jgi:hypothetical protein
MVNSMNFLDKIHLQKYIYLLNLFVSKQIEATLFEDLFLQIRREDPYWLNGILNENASKILDSFFLDIDSFNPDELFDSSDDFNINKEELYKRANETLGKLMNLL